MVRNYNYDTHHSWNMETLVMKSDAEEILDDVWELLDTHTLVGGIIDSSILYEYVAAKRLEFLPSEGDCAG